MTLTAKAIVQIPVPSNSASSF